jgi:predicted kinase
VRKELAGLAPAARAHPEHYSDAFSQLVYAELGRRAARHVRAHGGAIADGTFRRRRDREAFRSTFGAAAPVLFAELRAPLRVLAARAAVRDSQPRRISDATAQVVGRAFSEWQPLDEVPSAQHIIVRADQEAAGVLDDLLAALAGRRGARRTRP